jgi:ribosomal protein S27AE
MKAKIKKDGDTVLNIMTKHVGKSVQGLCECGSTSFAEFHEDLIACVRCGRLQINDS